MKVIKNYLEESVFKEIEKIVFSGYFPLYYTNCLAGLNDKSDFVFTHYFFIENRKNSDFMDSVVLPILKNIKYKKLLRVKLNCFTKKNKHIYSKIHTDQKDKHKVAIFSLNTCNGFTYFKENNKKIKSVKNQMLLFDGSKKHASVNQTDTNLRMNIHCFLY